MHPVQEGRIAVLEQESAACERALDLLRRDGADAWKRQQLAADTGMRPQEYVALPHYNVLDTAVKVDRALESGGTKISVTKAASSVTIAARARGEGYYDVVASLAEVTM